MLRVSSTSKLLFLFERFTFSRTVKLLMCVVESERDNGDFYWHTKNKQTCVSSLVSYMKFFRALQESIEQCLNEMSVRLRANML